MESKWRTQKNNFDLDISNLNKNTDKINYFFTVLSVQFLIEKSVS